MYDSRTDAPRCTVKFMPTSAHLRRTQRKGPWGDDPREPLLVRPTQPKSVAYYEAWLDWQDVQDEQAIAQDGFDVEDGFYDDGFMHMDDWAKWDRNGRKWTNTSERYDVRIAAVMDLDAKAKRQRKEQDEMKVLRRRWIEAEMAKGVRFPDLDPYTLEEIRSSVSTTASRSAAASNLRPRTRRYV